MIRSTKEFQVDLLSAAIEHFNDGMSRGVEYEVGWQVVDGNGVPVPSDKQLVQIWAWFGDDAEESKPTLTQQQEWVDGFLKSAEGRAFLEGYLKAYRDSLLQNLDAIVSNPLRWAELDDATKQALADYRQALLDVPQQEGFPENINWPIKPEVI